MSKDKDFLEEYSPMPGHRPEAAVRNARVCFELQGELPAEGLQHRGHPGLVTAVFTPDTGVRSEALHLRERFSVLRCKM